MSMNTKVATARRSRVLIVDDDPFATHLLGRLLRRHGYIAAEENDPNKAISMGFRFQPDVVLLDVHMPWKDGHEVAEEFAVEELLRRIPIVFITADALERDRMAETLPILVKPFALEDLLAILKRAVSNGVETQPGKSETEDILATSSVTWERESRHRSIFD
jgi:two-component system response regulator VicR